MTNAQIPTGRGWYPDPFSKGELLRMFDGARWTDQTRPIPADYDPAQPAGGPKKTASEKKADEAAPRANPTDAPALEKPKEEPVTQAPAARPQGKPARNGTAPMFATPTEKAAERPTGKTKQQPSPKKAPGKPAFNTPTEKAATAPAEKPSPKKAPAPAFATPTVRAERDDDAGQDAPAQKPDSPFAKPAAAAPVTPAPTESPAAPAFSFAKPANGGQAEAPARPPAPSLATPASEAQPEAPVQSAPPTATSDASAPTPSAVDDTPEEDSETVNNAFANVPQQAAFGMEAVEDFDADESSRHRLPGGLALKGFMGNTRLVTWIVAALLAAASIVVPLLVPSPVRGVAAECRSISEVVAAYDGAEDFAIDSDTQAKLASAVSTGALDEELTTLVTTAVEKNDLRPVVERCLPQES